MGVSRRDRGIRQQIRTGYQRTEDPGSQETAGPPDVLARHAGEEPHVQDGFGIRIPCGPVPGRELRQCDAGMRRDHRAEGGRFVLHLRHGLREQQGAPGKTGIVHGPRERGNPIRSGIRSRHVLAHVPGERTRERRRMLQEEVREGPPREILVSGAREEGDRQRLRHNDGGPGPREGGQG